MRRSVRILSLIAVVVAVLCAWCGVRRLLRAKPPPPTEAQIAQANRVQIYRDTFGVPHIFGKSDADAAFGLAYAHAEDDFATIQGVLAAARGKLGLLILSKTALGNDYYAQLAQLQEHADAAWPAVPADIKAVLDGYAAGINYYAALHPSEADARLLPVTGKDIALGFEHKLPLMLGVPDALQHMSGDAPLEVGKPLHIHGTSVTGSNAHAVARARSTDDITRLNINSHQPWEGPVAWYEAQVHSEEGWNMTGSLFPGAPMVLHGHNEHLGWAHTVNHFHAIDVYKLSMIDDAHYRYGVDSKALEEGEAELSVDIGLFVLKLHKTLYRSVQGPVMKSGKDFYAVRWPGQGRGALAAEQWFRMNKASNVSEWKAAMSLQGVPMFNTVYADRDTIGYVYNGLIPERSTEGENVLAGDDPAAVWSESLAFDDLPQVWNPASGFVFNCNTTPFHATEGPENPDPDEYDDNLGIETTLNNRGLRSLALFGGSAKISGVDFERFKFDRTYSRDSKLFKDVLGPIEALPDPTDKEKAAIALLHAWRGVANEEELAPALAFEAWRQIAKEKNLTPKDALDRAIETLEKGYGRIDVPLGEVQRLRRGKIDLPLGGGSDVLNAADTHADGAHRIGEQGDSYILLVDFAADGVHSRSINVYGASTHPDSPHYADQSPLFVKHQFKPTWRTEAELRGHMDREYSPGREPKH